MEGGAMMRRRSKAVIVALAFAALSAAGFLTAEAGAGGDSLGWDHAAPLRSLAGAHARITFYDEQVQHQLRIVGTASGLNPALTYVSLLDTRSRGRRRPEACASAAAGLQGERFVGFWHVNADGTGELHATNLSDESQVSAGTHYVPLTYIDAVSIRLNASDLAVAPVDACAGVHVFRSHGARSYGEATLTSRQALIGVIHFSLGLRGKKLKIHGVAHDLDGRLSLDSYAAVGSCASAGQHVPGGVALGTWSVSGSGTASLHSEVTSEDTIQQISDSTVATLWLTVPGDGPVLAACGPLPWRHPSAPPTVTEPPPPPTVTEPPPPPTVTEPPPPPTVTEPPPPPTVTEPPPPPTVTE